jgi:arylsulfatase A-like enzyme
MMNSFSNSRLLVFSLCLLGLLPLAAFGAEDSKRPNVLLMVADDLGFSDLGCYGSEIATPHLDQLAKDGLRLTRFYNTGRCCPSRTAILTGQYPHKVGVGHMVKNLGQPGYVGRVSEDAVTIAQVLKGAGYRSFLSGKWHLGTPDPTQHGFEEFYGTLISAQTFWDQTTYTRLPQGRTPRQYNDEEFYGTDALTDHALDFLELARKTPEQPWFLYLAYNAPHFPLHARPEDIAKYAERYHSGWDELRGKRLKRMKELGIVPEDTPLTPRSPYWNYGETENAINPEWTALPEDRRADLARRMAIYAAMIDRMDQNIGRLLADLKQQKELENTLIVFLSDNGACAEWDPFGFDGKSSPNNVLHKGQDIERMGGRDAYHSVGSGWANASNTPWRLYKHFQHEGGITSPCIIHWPKGNIRRGEIEHQPAHIIDLLPTIADIAQAAYQGKLPLPGVSLLPLMREGTVNPRMLFFEHEGHRAVHAGKWKLVAVRNRPWELYDVTSDRVELKDLAKDQPDLVERLASRWDQWAEENQVTPFPGDYAVEYLKPVKK